MFQEKNTTPFVLMRYYQSTKMSDRINAGDDIATILHDSAVQHFQQYPFHSLYFNLRNKEDPTKQDMIVPLNRNALIQQLLENKGGSCYHHNAVFQAILDDNGIDNWFISCLVHDPMTPEKTFDLATHIAIIFNYNDKLYLFDPGWDGTTLSVYPLPQGANQVAKHNKHQIRHTGNPDYPFSFEEIKSDGAVVRYDFNSTPTNLADYERAITYLNSKTYAFNTLFLFTGINIDNDMIRFINRRLIIQTISGEEKHNAEIPKNISVIDKLNELLGYQEGLMANLNVDDFKNPDLGSVVCKMISELHMQASPTLMTGASNA